MERIVNFATRTHSEKPEAIRCAHCGELVEPKQIGRIWTRGKCECEGATEERETAHRLREEADERREQARRENALEAAKMGAGLQGGYMDMTFENFDTALQPKAYQKAVEFDGTRSLILYSQGFGTGKTHLAVAMLHRWIEQGGGMGHFLHVPTLLSRIRRTFDQYAEENEFDIMDSIQRAGLVVLDDLGKEKASEWQEMTLYTLVNYRSVHGLPLVITMNLKPQQLERQIGPANVSRLLGMADFVEMEGLDYRLKEKRSRRNV